MDIPPVPNVPFLPPNASENQKKASLRRAVQGHLTQGTDPYNSTKPRFIAEHDKWTKAYRKWRDTDEAEQDEAERSKHSEP